jgi:hypothetical protein
MVGKPVRTSCAKINIDGASYASFSNAIGFLQLSKQIIIRKLSAYMT